MQSLELSTCSIVSCPTWILNAWAVRKQMVSLQRSWCIQEGGFLLVFFILNLIFGLLIEHPEVSFQISRFLCLLKPLGKQLENTFFCLNSNLGTIVFDRFEEEGHKHFEVRLHVLE